jgi:hypothetical protein
MTPPASARSIKRAQRCVESLKTAAECIGPIESDMAVFAITRGQFSMIDAVQHCLAQMGPCALSIWTWCIADYEIETFESLLHSRQITSATLVIDRAGEQQVAKTRSFRASDDKASRQGQLLTRWRNKFGPASIKVVLNHAKIATLDNGRHKVVVRGSMNLNHNPRFEQLDVTEGTGPFDLIRSIEQSLPDLPAHYTQHELQSATGAHVLFTPEQLKPFQSSLKIWKK